MLDDDAIQFDQIAASKNGAQARLRAAERGDARGAAAMERLRSAAIPAAAHRQHQRTDANTAG